MNIEPWPTKGIATNGHGVQGRWSHSGTMFGREIDGQWRTCIPEFVPLCCLDCRNYDPGEYGDYGSLLSGPYCEKNVFFPTKKGTCKKQEPWRRQQP